MPVQDVVRGKLSAQIEGGREHIDPLGDGAAEVDRLDGVM